MPKSQGKANNLPTDRFCKYIHRYCYQPRLTGYEFCIRHILEDKAAPFRQCTYVHQPSKKRCTNAAPKTEKSERRDNTLCPFHSKKAVEKIKTSIKKKVSDGPAGFLQCFEHFCSDLSHDLSYNQYDGLAERYDNAPCADVGWPASFSFGAEDKRDSPLLTNASRSKIFDDSNEYVSARDDPLKHAGVFTSKEVVSITKEKAFQLQRLYLQELKVLFLEHRENRIKYLKSVRNAADTTDVKMHGPGDKKLKALMDYHKSKRLVKIFRRKVHERRCELVGEAVKKRLCQFKQNGAECNCAALPLAKFCRNHISSDPNQVLFKPCMYGKNRSCEGRVLPVDSDAACENHMHFTLLSSKASEIIQELSPTVSTQEPEHFQSMDDIASLGLDVVTPGSLFGLDQFGEPGESTDTVLSEDQTDLMQIQEIPLNPATDILCDSRKSESEEEK